MNFNCTCVMLLVLTSLWVGSNAKQSHQCTLYLAESSIVDAGWGVFAGKDFELGDRLVRSPSRGTTTTSFCIVVHLLSSSSFNHFQSRNIQALVSQSLILTACKQKPFFFNTFGRPLTLVPFMKLITFPIFCQALVLSPTIMPSYRTSWGVVSRTMPPR